MVASANLVFSSDLESAEIASNTSVGLAVTAFCSILAEMILEKPERGGSVRGDVASLGALSMMVGEIARVGTSCLMGGQGDLEGVSGAFCPSWSLGRQRIVEALYNALSVWLGLKGDWSLSVYVGSIGDWASAVRSV